MSWRIRRYAAACKSGCALGGEGRLGRSAGSLLWDPAELFRASCPVENRRAVSRVPMVFLSVYGRDEVIARALEEGATDYIVKPLSPTELVARVRAALHRFEEPRLPEPAGPFLLGELAIDYERRRVALSGNTVELTPTEYDLLAELAAEAGLVVPHDRQLRRVRSPGKSGNLRVLRTHLMRLRKKLGEDGGNPGYIFAEPRVGYWMPEGEEVEGP